MEKNAQKLLEDSYIEVFKKINRNQALSIISNNSFTPTRFESIFLKDGKIDFTNLMLFIKELDIDRNNSVSLLTLPAFVKYYKNAKESEKSPDIMEEYENFSIKINQWEFRNVLFEKRYLNTDEDFSLRKLYELKELSELNRKIEGRKR